MISRTWGRFASGPSLISVFTVFALMPFASAFQTPPPSLKTVPVPLPSDLATFITDMNAAKQLGKALFWDMQVGSDGVQACATCHFHAGADSRIKNQINPGPADAFSVTSTGGGGPNYTLRAGDFPLHRLLVPDNNGSTVLSDSDDRVSSMGIFRFLFGSSTPGSAVENGTEQLDPNNFSVGGVNTRRVEPRNTPTTINAVFLHRIFWDGRANHLFNGQNPFGDTDPDAKILIKQPDDSVLAVRKLFNNAALASQSVGPPGSPFEMSFDGRTFPDIGKKLLFLRPLAGQVVAADDSVLGGLSTAPDPGLGGPLFTYSAMVQDAFASNLWSSNLDFGGFTQMEKNFSLFFGLSVLLYESTLVSDDSPYDRFMDGGGANGTASNALTAQQKEGLDIFLVRGRCIECHAGSEFAGATLQQIQSQGLLRRVALANGLIPAVVDNGFFNIGVRPTAEDHGIAVVGPFRPFSFARRVQLGEVIPGAQLVPPVGANERLGIDGAFKIPSLRNIELTGPFMHDGGLATLEQVVDFYSGGAHFEVANAAVLADRVGGIGGMSPTRKAALVAFLKALTDDRVRFERAPFDHPQLFVPNGQAGDQNTVYSSGPLHGDDELEEIPAVGQNGGAALAPFHTLLGPSVSVFPNTVVPVTENPLLFARAGIVLDRQPTSNVTINLSISNASQATITPTSVTFTPANWNVLQTPQIFGRQDGVVDVDTPFEVVTSNAISTDPQFSGMDVGNIRCKSVDSGFQRVLLTIEAEAGVCSGPMVRVNDAAASGGQFIVTPNGSGNQLNALAAGGLATYTFNVTVAGQYVVWGLEHAPTINDDTFFVRMDAGVIALWTLARVNGVTWVWDKVNNTGVVDPLTFNLTVGQHTLRIKHREDGAKLDKLIITNDLAFVPPTIP